MCVCVSVQRPPKVSVTHRLAQDDGGAAVDEEKINRMLGDRMQAKRKRDYDSADSLLSGLKAMGGMIAPSMPQRQMSTGIVLTDFASSGSVRQV